MRNNKIMKKIILHSARTNYHCTFDGLSHCTQDRIDAMNWLDTALCIVEGFGCVATNFVSCGVDNC